MLRLDVRMSVTNALMTRWCLALHLGGGWKTPLEGFWHHRASPTVCHTVRNLYGVAKVGVISIGWCQKHVQNTEVPLFTTGSSTVVGCFNVVTKKTH